MRHACALPLRNCDDGHRRGAVSAHQWGVCVGDVTQVPAAAGRTTGPGAARDRLEPGVGGDLWRSGGSRRVGMAAARMDADLHGLSRLSAVVVTAERSRLSVRARYMVLLDASLVASAAAVPDCPCGASCEQTADCLGSDELSSVGGADRSGGHPGTGVRDPDPCRGAWRGACDHDGDGSDQPHGLGDVSARNGSWKSRSMADIGEPS